MTGKDRLAILDSHVIQYRAPLFRALAAAGDIDLHVYYCSDRGVRPHVDPQFGRVVAWDIPLLEGHSHSFLRNYSPARRRLGCLSFINPGIVLELFRRRYDALLVFGWGHASCWLAFLGALLSRTPFFLMGDSNPLPRRPLAVRLAKSLALGALFRSAAGAFAVGRMNRDFYAMYGLRSERLFPVPYAVDNESFGRIAAAVGPARVAELRSSFGLDGRPVILFCGKLLPKKRPADALHAFARLPRGSAQLLFVGDGAERQGLEREVARLGIEGVAFGGFVNQARLPEVYAACDVLVLPSEVEPWGLVVNEAMSCGLPVVVSDRCGAAYDLVDGNGAVFPVGDVERLAQALGEIVGDADVRQRMRRRSLELIRSFSFAADVEGIRAALRSLAGPRRAAAA